MPWETLLYKRYKKKPQQHSIDCIPEKQLWLLINDYKWCERYILQWLQEKAKRERGFNKKAERRGYTLEQQQQQQGPQLSCAVLDPHAALPLPLRGPLSATAAPWVPPSLARGWQVLVDGPAVGDEAHAQLEVSGEPAVCSQSQDQEGGEQQEAHHQQGYAASVVQKVWAVEGRPVGLHLETRRGESVCFSPPHSHVKAHAHAHV